MNPERWARVQDLFHRVADLSPDERERILTDIARSDAGLAEEVRALLCADQAPTVLDRGLDRVAEALLDRASGLPAASFGPWRPVRVLGEGGMGVVYLAERADLGHQAAIKILRDASLSPARRERFANEQRTLAQLSHPAIAQLFDADVLPDGTPWFVMEYVEGVPLTEYCRTRGTSIPGRLQLFRAVCEAVQHAHRHAVIHRDLKPSNIYVKADGTIKLLDFGIAKHLETLDVPVDQTRTGLRLMTPAYAAPEQMRGDRVGIHTDIYALGVILYELLAGRLPFDLTGKTPAEAVTVVVEQEPERPSVSGRSGIPGPGQLRAVGRAGWADLDVLCLTAMHKDPQRRYRTVEALIRDIDHFLGGEPLEARPDTVPYRLGKFVQRNRGAVVASAVVLAALVGLSVFYTVRLARARDAALAEAARTQRIQRFTLSLFQGGEESVGPADSLRVVTLVDRGLQEARSLDVEPAVQAELFHTLGGIYQRLGRLDQADSLLRAALAQRLQLFGRSHAAVAESQVALGLLHVDRPDYPEGERLIREGLGTAGRLVAPDHPVVTQALTALGRVLQEEGRYDESIAVLERSVQLQGPDTTADLSETISTLAGAHFYAGRYDVSDSLNAISLAMTRRLYGERHPAVAEDLVNLGAAQLERGKYPEAERFYREALDITRAWYGEQHPRTASHLTMLGRSLQYQGRHDEAVTVQEQALTVQERIFGPVHPRVASALNELATIALARSQYPVAEAMFLRMERIYRGLYPDDHYLIALAMSNRASVYMTSRRFVEAEPLFREVIRRFTRSQGADHNNTAIARIKLGRVLLGQRKYTEAAEQSLAGYESLSRTADRGISFLRAARTDLVASYEALGQAEKAARFRAELADTAR